MNQKPIEITNILSASVDLIFCESVRDAINRDPNRRAIVKREGLLCWVVDYSRPIKQRVHTSHIEQNMIIGWEPMEEPGGRWRRETVQANKIETGG